MTNRNTSHKEVIEVKLLGVRSILNEFRTLPFNVLFDPSL